MTSVCCWRSRGRRCSGGGQGPGADSNHHDSSNSRSSFFNSRIRLLSSPRIASAS
jgi:hypothetical protein